MPVFYLAPERIRPHHGVRNRRDVRVLTRSMRARGWVGRPVLGEMVDGGRVQAWTGTHRLAAARRARLQRVPVRLVDVDQLRVAGHERTGGAYLLGLPAAWYDADRAEWLATAGDTFGAALLRQEVAANAAETGIRCSRNRVRGAVPRGL